MRSILEKLLACLAFIPLAMCSRDTRVRFDQLQELTQKGTSEILRAQLGAPRAVLDDKRLMWQYVWTGTKGGACVLDVFLSSADRIEGMSLIETAATEGDEVVIEWPYRPLQAPQASGCVRR